MNAPQWFKIKIGSQDSNLISYDFTVAPLLNLALLFEKYPSSPTINDE